MDSSTAPQLISLVQTAFDPRTRQRGFDYAPDRVSELHVDAGHACGLVHGTRRRPYDVRMDLASTSGGSALIVACSCPMGGRLQPCKHVWALLVCAASRGPSMWAAPADLVAGVVVHSDGQFEIWTADDDEDQWWAFERVLELLALGDASGQLPASSWRALVADASEDARRDRPPAPVRASKKPVLEYVLSADAGAGSETDVHLRVFQRSPNQRGLGRPTAFRAGADTIADLTDPTDRAACAELFGSGPDVDASNGYYYRPARRDHGAAVIAPPRFAELLRPLCATGRLGHVPDRPVRARYDQLVPLRWDGDAPYAARLELVRAGDRWRARLSLVRDDGAIAPGEVRVLCRDLAIAGDRLIRFQRGTAAAAWIESCDRWGELELAEGEIGSFVDALAEAPAAPALGFADGAPWSAVSVDVQPRLRFSIPARRGARVRGQLDFVYGQTVADGTSAGAMLVDAEAGRVVRRDLQAERAAVDALFELPIVVHAKATVAVEASDFVEVVRAVLELGWLVEADDVRVRRASSSSVRVESGIDWFDVNVAAVFDGDSVALPELLAATRRGSPFIELGDGSKGLLPESWLAGFGALVASGQLAGDAVRFSRRQASLLDALLATAPRVDVDEQFAAARARLREIDRIEPAAEPAGFAGQLRPYQQDGVGWLLWLRHMGFGGCLADDMGLGKTIQVLAALVATRDRADGPALVVAPRSLTHNWIDEAARFAPGLNVLDYTGSRRKALRAQFPGADIVVTTYGIVRRDAVDLASFQFDTVILDEAQAIKNASSLASKACRSLRAEHRLALTGTPVENRLDDLFAIFEFINPGLLVSSRWRKLVAGADNGGDSLTILAGALRPFLLRRTKNEVLDDLPDKTEQVIYCRMDRDQRRKYEQLRGHYQKLLKKRVETDGMSRAKFQVLEALLRLRQAACHPGLVDDKQRAASSAKLDTLIERIEELAGTGEKVLVFSQFTSLLSIARERLDAAGIVYEYLDGRTRKRGARVERFQTDDACTVFLISLKAGGHGLNLTAASYVFLLDPWWNPAVEAQAIDRAHRIGQTRSVFAYRLIAENTVEDKILELQQQKRELADGIFQEQAGVLTTLSPEELSRLLS